MNLNDVLKRKAILINILLKDGNKELSKELKVKIMRIRTFYSKVIRTFEEEVRNFEQKLITDEFKELINKEKRTQLEDEKYQKVVSSIDYDYAEFVRQRSEKEIKGIDDTFTFDEYCEIIEVNSGNNVVLNDVKISAADFLEIIYDLFVNDDLIC